MILLSLYTIPLGTCKKARPVNAGSHYLHYILNDLNAEKNPSPSGFRFDYIRDKKSTNKLNNLGANHSQMEGRYLSTPNLTICSIAKRCLSTGYTGSRQNVCILNI